MRRGGRVAPCTLLSVLLSVLLSSAWLCALGVGVLAWLEVTAGVQELRHETALGKLVKAEKLKLRVGQEDERLPSAAPTRGPEGDNERPSAHLTHVNVAARQRSRLAWGDGGADGSAASLRGGMLYGNGSLTVPRAGTYFVFSQVQLHHVACGRVRGSPHVEVVHSVRVTAATTATTATATTTTAATATATTTATTTAATASDSGGGAATVMSTTWVPCASAASARPTWFQSSHLGGVFHLQAGSSVAVHVSHADVVADKREWNFFGAFLL